MIDENGVNQGSLGQYGCAVTSTRWLLLTTESTLTPANDIWLNNNAGYESGGYIYWQKAADYSAGKWRISHPPLAPAPMATARVLRSGPPSKAS